MSNNENIKRRIVSIKNTQKVTSAMQKISVAKMKKVQDRILKSRYYSDGLFELIQYIGSIKDYKHPLLRQVKKEENITILIIAPNRGFVGGLITELEMYIRDFMQKLKKDNSNIKIEAIGVHKKAKDIIERLNLKSHYNFFNIKEYPTTTEITHIVHAVERFFIEEKTDSLYIIYPHFINIMKYNISSKRLLPIKFKIDKKSAQNNVDNTQFDFEPNPKAVINSLLDEYLENQIFTAILDNNAVENSARMIAMKNATDNAIEIQEKLQLEFHKKRQMKITQEIIEIISNIK